MNGLRRWVGWVWVLGLSAGSARADYKAFAHTYPFFTQPAGNLELEWWVSAETQSFSTAAVSTLFEHRIELEYGLTDRWDLSLYQVFQQPSQEALVYDSIRLETRYQLTRKYAFPVDLLGYAEIERPADLHQPTELELKLIACRDFGPWFLQTNWITEVKLAGGDAFGYWFALYAGLGYEFHPSFRLGVEAMFDWKVDSLAPGAATAKTIHVGPSISAARGRLWAVLTPCFRVAGQSNVDDLGNDLSLRFIVGANL